MVFWLGVLEVRENRRMMEGITTHKETGGFFLLKRVYAEKSLGLKFCGGANDKTGISNAKNKRRYATQRRSRVH